MSLSKREIPHVYFQTELRMDGALGRLDALNQSGAPKTTVTALLCRAVALSLLEHPRFNAHWTEDGLFEIADVNLSVAIALDDGLIAPALLGADRLPLAATAEALRDLTARARTGKLVSKEVTSGSFTLSNLGMFEVTSFYGIITPPQVAILAVGSTRDEVVIADGVPRSTRVMTASLSADHRAVDGADAARFLTAIKARVEDPALLD